MTRRMDLPGAAAMAYRVLLDQRVDVLPVDPLVLLRKYQNVRLITYDEAADMLGMPLTTLIRQLGDVEAYSFRQGEQCIVAYRAGGNPARQRFTLAHELGHLVLQHGGGLQAEEREADVFASYLLCPRVAVTSLRAGRGDLVERVAHAFYVSLACARMALAQPEQQISADLTCQLSEQLKAAAAKIAERYEKTSPKTTNVFGKGL